MTQRVAGSAQVPGRGRDRPDAAGALRALMEGNERFVAGGPRHGHRVDRAVATAAGQHPYALVLTCLDSRVPPEAIFDQDFGGICVVRTGGHALDEVAIGSIEFAVAQLDVPLVVVLGHSRCGAVGAAMRAVRDGDRPPGSLGYLVDEIVPAVQEAGLAGPDPYGRAVERHVRRTVDRLVSNGLLAEAHRAGRLAVTGAVYDLDSGRVTSTGT